ncbi:hypothetical protein GH733_019494 [Mirounga leonina]|nr:hypothetical protein GH733_019494 [Mirounga leonina]
MAEVNGEVPGSNSDSGEDIAIPNPKQFRAITESNRTACQLDDKESEKCPYGLTWFSYQVQKILMKVKLALQQNAEKRKKGKKSTILVLYHRQSKKKNENQPKMDQESLSPTPCNALAYQGPENLK